MKHYFKIPFVSIVFVLSILGCGKQNERPNIIFILADDMGYSDCQVFGQEKFITPHIDELASEGMIFTDFYAGAPVCGPSRSVLMTGQHMGHTTVRGNNTIVGGKPGMKGKKTVYRENLTSDDLTVGNIMQQAGYRTALVGKWHLGGYDSTATPLDRGFDEFYGWLINAPETYASTYWPDRRYNNRELYTIKENVNNAKGYYHTDICTDEALAYLEQHKDGKLPFMLMLCYSNPHAPLDAPDNGIYDDREWTDDNKTYASMLYHLDQSVGQLKDYLEESGLSKNTIVFFTSDNGPRSNYSQELTDVVDFFNSNGNLRGYKRDLYEGGIRVPMITWSPRLIEGGTVSKSPYYFADMMSTFAEIGAYKGVMNTDGMSFYKEMMHQQSNENRRFLYWEFFERGYKQAVRYGQWKAVIIEGKLSLYDLSNDIGEEQNVAKENPQIVSEINTYLKTCRTPSPYWPVD
ncbi:MAG: arylsulfatase [Bacteroidales bacterium]|jgi:arylsulfatase A-like enzyme|nr:arylsulfatase [Bacteroidales bacterium]